MDLLSFFKSTPEKQIERLRKKVKEPHGDPAVRQGAAQKLFSMGTDAALRALLDRFTISVSPSVQDESEKEEVFRWLVSLGQKAVPPLLAFLRNERFLYWPIKTLQEILTPEDLARELTNTLEFLWTNPPATPIPKTQIIRSLGALHTPALETAVRTYLTDQDDDVRLASVEYLIARPEEEVREAILQCYFDSSDRPRVRSQILELLVEKGWSVRGHKPAMEESLPFGFLLTREGKVKRIGA